PFIVIWEATQACPLACRHCRASARPWRDPDELSTGEAIELMGQVVEFGRPAPLFVITGGDPFTRDDLTTLVRSGSDLGLAVSVSPSGTPTLTRQALASLREAGARAISLSLDAAGSGKHDGNSTSTAPTANPTNWHQQTLDQPWPPHRRRLAPSMHRPPGYERHRHPYGVVPTRVRRSPPSTVSPWRRGGCGSQGEPRCYASARMPCPVVGVEFGRAARVN